MEKLKKAVGRKHFWNEPPEKLACLDSFVYRN